MTVATFCITNGLQGVRMRYRRSFYKWGITEREADHVIAQDVCYRMHDSKRGNQQYMFVGFTLAGDLIEVGIEVYPEGEEDWAFHARKAGREAQQVWEENK